jgi:tripartite ATP-independent transporter DctP family solute receptor
MVKFRSIFIASLVILVVLIGSGAVAIGQTLTFTYADNQPAGSPGAEAALKFSKLVEERTDGQIKIEVYTDAQLGEEAATTEQLNAGALDFNRINVIQLTQFVDEYEVYTLPYMFVDDTHKWAVVHGDIGASINEKLTSETGIEVLGFMEWGWRSFYTKDPVYSLADLEGMRIRVMDSPANVEMITRLGASPTPMPYADVYTALQTGVIDGAENDYVSYLTTVHYEVAPYYTVDEHTVNFGVLIMSEKAKEQMSSEQFYVIQQCAQEAIEWHRVTMLGELDRAKEKVINAGSEIIEVDKSEFMEAVAPMYDGHKLEKLIENVKALQN